MVSGKQAARITVLVICAGLAISALAARAPAVPAGGEGEAEDVITLNFQNADIRAFISTVARTTGRNFIVDPRVKGQVTITSGTRMNADEVYGVFLSVLQVHNFAAVDAGNDVIKIVPASLVKQSSTPISSTLQPGHGDQQLTQVYKLKFASVQEMVPILRPLLPPTSHFAAHGDSNTLVFTGTADNVRRVLRIVQSIDRPRAESDIHVVKLHYATATDLAKILANLLSASQKRGGAKTTTTEPASVQADEATNALIIQASNDEFTRIQGVIASLDVRRPQVFIEVLIAEVTEDKAEDLGVRWNFGDDNLSTGESTGSTNFSDIKGGLKLGYIKGLVENLDGTLVPDIQVVVSALRADSNTNILSTPNLLTLDNQAASIVVGQEVPFITGQYTTSGSTTVTTSDPNNPGETTAVSNPFQTIERKQVGLKLKLTPQINQDASIRLEIEQEVSSVNPTVVQGASDLITNTRSISTTVMIDDGQIVVLGGLIRDDFKDTVEMVPGLGKIPLLGIFFRKKGKAAVKTNLMVFLRPKIVRTASDLAGYTRQKYERMRGTQMQSLPDSGFLLYKDKPPVLPQLEPENEPASR